MNEQRDPIETNSNSGDWEHVENVPLTGATPAGVCIIDTLEIKIKFS